MMTDEMGFSIIEERLQTDASRLLSQHHQFPATQLQRAYRRRQSVRVRFVAATALAFLTAISGAWVAWQENATLPLKANRPVASSHPRTGSQREPAKSETGSLVLRPKELAGESFVAVPFEIDDPASGKIISGIYVPEQVEPIEWDRLSPAARHAVGAVLEIDESVQDGKVI